MKKRLLFLASFIAISGSLFAQQNLDKKVNQYIERVEAKISLTSEEKETLKTLNSELLTASLEISKNYEKGSEELKAKRKENNKKYGKALIEAFGAERAKEIKNAARKKKKKKN